MSVSVVAIKTLTQFSLPATFSQFLPSGPIKTRPFKSSGGWYSEIQHHSFSLFLEVVQGNKVEWRCFLVQFSKWFDVDLTVCYTKASCYRGQLGPTVSSRTKPCILEDHNQCRSLLRLLECICFVVFGEESSSFLHLTGIV